MSVVDIFSYYGNYKTTIILINLLIFRLKLWLSLVQIANICCGDFFVTMTEDNR